MDSNSVCNHTSESKIVSPRSGNPIGLSPELLQTEMDDTKSYYQLIMLIGLSGFRFWRSVCSSRSVTWSLVSQTQFPLREGCIHSYRSSTLSYNERCSEEE